MYYMKGSGRRDVRDSLFFLLPFYSVNDVMANFKEIFIRIDF